MPNKDDCIITRFNTVNEEAFSTVLAQGEVVCFSARSPVKKTSNEDALALIPINDRSVVLVVADGLGGMPNGDQASQMVIECLVSSLINIEKKPQSAILDGIDEANSKLLKMATGAGTTVSIAEITGNQLRTYHVGDSSILLVTNQGKIKYRTIPHSPIGYALSCGAIGPKEAMLHPERKLMSNHIGWHGMYITVGPIIELTPLDTLILSSDGLSDNLFEEEIADLICQSPMMDAVNHLIRQCKHNMLEVMPDRRRHPDDLTLISFRQKT